MPAGIKHDKLRRNKLKQIHVSSKRRPIVRLVFKILAARRPVIVSGSGQDFFAGRRDSATKWMRRRPSKRLHLVSASSYFKSHFLRLVFKARSNYVTYWSLYSAFPVVNGCSECSSSVWFELELYIEPSLAGNERDYRLDKIEVFSSIFRGKKSMESNNR